MYDSGPSEDALSLTPGSPMCGMQVYVDLLETVGGLLALALAPHCTFLPQPYVRTLLNSPVIGQDISTKMALPAVSDLWSGQGHRVSLWQLQLLCWQTLHDGRFWHGGCLLPYIHCCHRSPFVSW